MCVCVCVCICLSFSLSLSSCFVLISLYVSMRMYLYCVAFLLFAHDYICLSNMDHVRSCSQELLPNEYLSLRTAPHLKFIV